MYNEICNNLKKGCRWLGNATINIYNQKIRDEQFENDMVGFSIFLLDNNKTDLEICDIIHKYFGIENINEIKGYIYEAKKWIKEHR